MKLYKYCASGNDFILMKAEKKSDRSLLAKELCDRYQGIGADGFIVIVPHEKYDFEWEFYNNDGSYAAMCGNGSRAAAHFAHHILGKAKHMYFLTGAGVIEARVENDLVEVALGKVKYVKEPFEFQGKIFQECDTGVPHLVHFCDDINIFDKMLCEELRYRYNANVNYAQIVNHNTLKVRTYERGVEDETQACGTGMGACFYLAYLHQRLNNEVKVFPKSQEELHFRVLDANLYFKGRVKYCFEANYNFT